MNISQQLKNYRKKLSISQEELAEVIHVSRQTISNWENDKSYPDIQSLVLLSEYFKISLDELVKGDIILMKNKIKQKQDLQRTQGNKAAVGMVCSMAGCIISAAFMVKSLEIGRVGFVIFFIIGMWYATKVEKIKKENDVKTYKEVVAFFEDKECAKLDESERKKRRRKELVGYMLISVLITLVGTVALAFIFDLVLN